MIAKIVAMMRRVHLDDCDLELASMALRSLAVRYGEGPRRQSNPTVRERLEKHAAGCEGLAERMGRFREVSGS